MKNAECRMMNEEQKGQSRRVEGQKKIEEW
jgi:hypothetical protein